MGRPKGSKNNNHHEATNGAAKEPYIGLIPVKFFEVVVRPSSLSEWKTRYFDEEGTEYIPVNQAKNYVKKQEFEKHLRDDAERGGEKDE